MAGLVHTTSWQICNPFSLLHLTPEMFMLIGFPSVGLSRDGRRGLQRGDMICCLLDLGSSAGSSNSSLSYDNSSRGDSDRRDHS